MHFHQNGAALLGSGSARYQCGRRAFKQTTRSWSALLCIAWMLTSSAICSSHHWGLALQGINLPADFKIAICDLEAFPPPLHNSEATRRFRLDL